MVLECNRLQDSRQPEELAAPPLERIQESDPSDLEPDDRLDINAAGSRDLESLPGVGPVLAQRILEYRANNPPFRRVEEILIIRGIGRRKFQALRGRIRVAASTGPATTLPCSASAKGLR